MRILNIYSGNLYGGVERMLAVMQASGALPGSSFVLCFEGRLSRELRGSNGRVTVLHSPRVRSPRSVWRFGRELAALLAAERPDRVLCHGVWSYCMAASTVRRAGLSPVLFLHDVPEPKKLMYRWAWLHPPSLCITNSDFVRSRLRALGGDVAAHVVHPLVEAPAPLVSGERDSLRAALGVAVGDVVILQASRLDRWKGHRALLEALARVKDVPAWKAWIAGEPQRPEEQAYKEELSELARQLGISERVSFIGLRSDMPAVLAASDIYCQPNEQPEPFGMVFVEALAAGRPVVARDEGGVREIVTAECGMLCPAGVEPIAQALRRLVLEPELRQRLGAAGRERAEASCSASAFAGSLVAALADASP